MYNNRKKEGVSINLLTKKQKYENIRQTEYEKMLEEFEGICKENINTLVRYNEGNYIVFIDMELELDWVITDAYDDAHANTKNKRNKLLSDIEALQHRPTVAYLDKQTKKAFFLMLAEAWVYALDEEFSLSKSYLTNVEKYLENRNHEICRKWQISFSFLFFCILSSVFMVIFINSNAISELLHIQEPTIKRFSYISFGLMGALFSILCKTGKTSYNCESGRLLNALEIFCRMFASLLSAFIVLCLFELDLVFSAFNTHEHMNTALIMICFISGFCERLVPSLLNKFIAAEMGDTNDEKNVDYL